MSRWRKALFIAMARNAASPIDHFGLPVNKTVVVSSQVSVRRRTEGGSTQSVGYVDVSRRTPCPPAWSAPRRQNAGRPPARSARGRGRCSYLSLPIAEANVVAMSA